MRDRAICVIVLIHKISEMSHQTNAFMKRIRIRIKIRTIKVRVCVSCMNVYVWSAAHVTTTCVA